MTADTVELAVALTEAWLGNPNTRAAADDVPAFILAAHAALAGLSSPKEPQRANEDGQEVYTPAVSVRQSLADPNRIVSMITGEALTSLTRHLSSRGITPDEYRQRYGLKADYPMVAPGYSKARAEASKRLLLGGKAKARVEDEPTMPPPTVSAKKPRARLGIAQAKAAAKAHLGQANDVT